MRGSKRRRQGRTGEHDNVERRSCFGNRFAACGQPKKRPWLQRRSRGAVQTKIRRGQQGLVDVDARVARSQKAAGRHAGTAARRVRHCTRGMRGVCGRGGGGRGGAKGARGGGATGLSEMQQGSAKGDWFVAGARGFRCPESSAHDARAQRAQRRGEVVPRAEPGACCACCAHRMRFLLVYL